MLIYVPYDSGGFRISIWVAQLVFLYKYLENITVWILEDARVFLSFASVSFNPCVCVGSGVIMY